MKVRAALIIGAFLAVLSPGGAFGQGFQGGLRGVIKDSGGVVPGVEVTLTNEQTNISRSTVTNDSGEYNFTSVEPGTYKLKAALQGYKTIEQGGIRIGTQTFITLDETIEVGRIEENITVTASAPLIETSNASQGTVIDSQVMQTLPNSGRAAFLVSTTVPTVVASGDGQFVRQQDQTNASLLSLGGGTRRGNNYTLDGVPITDITNRAVANPTMEALDDVKVQIHTYDAEMGRTGGGVFNTTLKSGSNDLHGSAFFQTRPVWGQANNYFGALAGQPKPDSVYYMGGGGVGGPIVKNRTFFWSAAEMYHDVSTRNVSVIFPTAAERTGDFSALTNSKGQPVIIYNPLTRQPFQNNKIPPGMINQVAANIASYLPLPQVNVDNGNNNYTITGIIDDYFEQLYTGKVEHKFTDKVSLTGFYLYNRTNEPCTNYFSAGQNGPTRFADPNDYLLRRRPQILALNNTWIPNDHSVVALRFGWTRFVDNSTTTIPFDPATLGFSQTFLNQVGQTGVPKFPTGDIAGYDQAGGTFGAINPSYRTYKSWGFNGSYARFFGDHSLKVGADYRKIGFYFLSPGNASGNFNFDSEYTSSTGANPSDSTSGNGFASFLLGYPTADTGSPAGGLSTMTLTTPLNFYTNYYSGYAQDDWRVSSKFTLNYGLRLEHETGIAEQNNNQTVGFDPAASLSGVTNVVTIPADPVAGTPARTVSGGLLYAGVNGNKTTQGNPPAVKFSPRVGAVYSINSSTVVRAGYGLYWSPWNYPVPSATANNYGQTGYTQNTPTPQTPLIPTVTLTNPFPNGLVAPLGNSLGAKTGVGTTISYIDPNRTAPRVQQYSADVQKEIGGGMAISVSYIGARGDHLPLGGTIDTPINVNQVDPTYLRLGSALNQQVTNPFLGNAAFIGTSLYSAATVSRAQLLRPYPQYLNVLDRQVSEGVNRYNAAVVEWTKRPTHGWGGRISYTYSVLKDNQIGETNFFATPAYSQSSNTSAAINNYNYIAGSQYFNPRADYAYSVLDTPHHLVLAPIAELPFGKGKKWANESEWADLVVGGWTAAAVINIQSGFPIGIYQSDNTGLLGGTQRPNLVPGVSPATSGDFEGRLSSAANNNSAAWVNSAAYSLAPANTFGTAPRTNTDVRTPPKENVDVSFGKDFHVGGGKVAQVKIEVFNLFNRVDPRVSNMVNRLTASGFGQITTQSGFMRLTQIMFRFTF